MSYNLRLFSHRSLVMASSRKDKAARLPNDCLATSSGPTDSRDLFNPTCSLSMAYPSIRWQFLHDANNLLERSAVHSSFPRAQPNRVCPSFENRLGCSEHAPAYAPSTSHTHDPQTSATRLANSGGCRLVTEKHPASRHIRRLFRADQEVYRSWSVI